MIELGEIGIFRDLGSVTPNTIDWTPFPVTANQGNSILIARYSGNFALAKTYLYLREIYSLQPKIVGKRWVKLYPKPEQEVINAFMNLEFTNQNMVRTFEVIKWMKYRLPRKVIDREYSIGLSEVLIFPQYVRKYRESYLPDAVIQQITSAVAAAIGNLQTG